MTDATGAALRTDAPPSSHGQRLWAVLLVVDSFFVIIFGGALAAKIYQHGQAPSVNAALPRHRRAPKPATAKPEKPPEPAVAAPAPSAKPEPPPPAKPAQPADALRPPKPSLLHSAPTRANAQPQAAAPAPAAAAPAVAVPAPTAKTKALPTEFLLKSPAARTVELVGAFIVHGGKKAMVSHPDGTWTLTLYLTPNTYRYWFLVNGKKTLDPHNPKTDRGASVMAVGR